MSDGAQEGEAENGDAFSSNSGRGLLWVFSSLSRGKSIVSTLPPPPHPKRS